MSAKKVEVICRCGNKFVVNEAVLKWGKGKFCSNSCKLRFRQLRPRDNKVELICPCGKTFLKYKSGLIKGNWGIYCSQTCRQKYNTSPIFKIGHPSYRSRYEGDDISYAALHDWVHATKKKTGICEHCGTAKKTQWANKSHQYKREIDDWIELCIKCHSIYDRRSPNFGSSVRKFGRRQPLKPKKNQSIGYVHPNSTPVIQLDIYGN